MNNETLMTRWPSNILKTSTTLEGEGVWITYQLVPGRFEILDYSDEQRELRFRNEEIDSLKSKLGKLISVTLGTKCLTATHSPCLYFCQTSIAARDKRTPCSTLAIWTKHLSGIQGTI
jgi:hypothetical protein